jgi:hypothetical protein
MVCISYKDSKPDIVSAMKDLFESESNGSGQILKPFKILLSLLDQPEYGDTVFDSLFLVILSSIYNAHQNNHEQYISVCEANLVATDSINHIPLFESIHHLAGFASLVTSYFEGARIPFESSG